MLTILIVEDERDVRIGLRVLLEDEGYRVVEAAAVAEALAALDREPPDLFLVDVKLPDGSGFDLCRTVRNRGLAAPIVVVTAQVDSHDVVAGLDAGADDYITKPFVPQELAARVRAVLRRFERASAHPGGLRSFEFDDLVIRPAEGIVTLCGAPLDLTRLEFLLLTEFALHDGLVLSREQLLERVWGYERSGDNRLIDAHVSRLRAKIEPHTTSRRFLVTVRGLGYRFEGSARVTRQ
ncbi:MAG: response regulator transcription factor [Acidimicrobiales bacterium]|nr:response regulator transcription factor [Acidimicrobiales bacterium]